MAGCRFPAPAPTSGKGCGTICRRSSIPPRGWIATANNNIHPPGFSNPLFFTGQAPYWRYQRIAHLLEEGKTSGKKFAVGDLHAMLRDSYKTEAEELKRWFQGWTSSTPDIERARSVVTGWDNQMRRDSAGAAVYQTWRGQVDIDAVRRAPAGYRRALVEAGLRKAVEALAAAQGTDSGGWRWGRIHSSVFKHPLLSAFDLPAVERDGGADTVNATGAVYRLITDFSNPDQSIVTIGPGISGQPGSPFYGNLLEGWARGEFFPLAFTRAAVEKATKHTLILKRTAGR